MIKKILIVLAVILALFGAALYWVDSKIDKNEVSSLIVQKIESTLVGTKAEISDLNYNLGFSLNFEIAKLSIKDKKSKKLIIGINQASVDMNVLAILFGSGKIDININSPLLNISKDSNGELSLKKYIKVTQNKESKQKPIKNQKNQETKIEVPSFIEKSSLNFKLTNLEVNYTEIKTSTFKVDKILIKDLGFDKTTAYEFVSSIDYKIDEINDINFKVLLFGELSLKDIISNKSFRLNSYLYVKDLRSSLLKSKLDDVETKIDFKLDENSNITALVSSKSKELIDLNISARSNKDNLFIDIKKLDLKLAKIIELVDIEGVNVNKSMISTIGTVESNFSFSKLNPDLHMKLSGPITLNKMNKSHKISSLSLDLVMDTLSVKASANIMEGDFTISSETKVDLLKSPNSVESLNKISSRVIFNNGVIPKEWLKANLNIKDGPATKEVQSKPSVNTNTSMKLPLTETQVVVNNLKMGTSTLSSKGKIKTFSNKVQSDGFAIDLDESKTSATFSVSLNEIVETKFNLTSQKLNLLSFKALLPENLEQLTGIIDIKTSGKVSLSDKMDYSISGIVNAKDGSLKGLNLRDIINSFVGKLSKYLPKKDLKLSEEYEMLNLNFLAKPTNILINNLKVIGKNKSLDLELKGNIGAESKKSELVGKLRIKDLVSDVEKFSSDGKLPLLLKGEGYLVRPSISYTTTKLVKNKANNEIQKVKSKLKDKAKDFFKGLSL